MGPAVAILVAISATLRSCALSWNLSLHISPPGLTLIVTQRVHSIMAKTRSRLLTHFSEPSQRSQHRFSTLSNTSKHVCKVITESTSSSSLVEQQNQPEEALLDNVQPMVVDNLDGTPADVGHTANISVRTKAKRYQNSVRQYYPFIEFSYI